MSEKGPVLSRQQGAIRELARAVRLVRAGRGHVWLCGVCTVGCLSSSVPPAEGDSAPGASRTDEYTTQGQGPAAPMLRVRAVSPCRPAPQRHATEHGIWPGCSSPSACDANAIARSPVPGPVARPLVILKLPAHPIEGLTRDLQASVPVVQVVPVCYEVRGGAAALH